MLSEDGYVAEGIVSNLFFVKNDTLYTPSLDTGILPGITRAHVIESRTAAAAANPRRPVPMGRSCQKRMRSFS